MSRRLKNVTFVFAGILIGISSLLTVQWFLGRTVETPLAYISWDYGGRPSVFDCRVRFQDGSSVDGFNIAFLSNSGWTPSECIDACGKAYVRSGENDVQAIRLNDKVLKEWPNAYWIGIPSVHGGMRVDIILKNKEDWFISSSGSK